MNLKTSLLNVKGVGPKSAELLGSAGLKTVKDLIYFLPRTYEDYSGGSTISEMKPGKVVLRARVESVSTRYARRNLKITTAILEDSSGDKVQAIWFNQPYRKNQLSSNSEYLFSGEFGLSGGRYQLKNPACQRVENLPVVSDKIVPVYSSKRGLKPSFVKKIMSEIKPIIAMLLETLPEEIVKAEGLVSKGEALYSAHFPTSRRRLELARNRLAFDELLTIILAARLNRNDNQRIKGYSVKFNADFIKELVSRLPFNLTNAQRRAAWEILQDMEKNTPMNRLLQGDVGSGKTVVAAIAAYQVVMSDGQVAIMAPTEVLASQHQQTLDSLLSPLGIRVGLLTGSVKGKKRQEILNNLINNKLKIIVGTHALFQKDVAFSCLRLVVIDEQHRFGVNQRQMLLDKTNDDHLPHLLSMTATPIPRSLQLTVFGDLDISILNEMPKNRQIVHTKIVLPNSRNEVYDLVNDELQSSHQAYFVAKVIEEDSITGQVSVDTLYKKIVEKYKGWRVGILHGKMNSEMKNKVMRQFENHELDILVSTTVIEVGVDVPNATVMVIENADQFGLAQLHQLRGRVGRGKSQSYCYLIQSDSKPPTKRLREIERSSDGFYLAEVDLEIRGAGEIYGTAQHGDINLKIANISDSKLIKRVSGQVDWLMDRISLQADYLDKFPDLRSIINKYQKLTTLN